ncbi:MAG: helix-turn-helix domain-containing protein [Chloroflexi bacterium]|nr:helix-turn-helix domain-containing protein [Chloroflexota bacterium]
MVEIAEPDVGMRLRFLRDQQGLSLRMLAERCGLSINAISQIERGENSPTVSSLHRLAKALNVPITDFFQPESRQRLVFVKRDMGLRTQSKGVIMESLGIGLTNQQLEPFRIMVGPEEGNTSDPISHSGEEFVNCLNGQIEYTVGGSIFRLEQGDSLLFDATQPHAYRNVLPTPASILLVFQTTRDLIGVQRLHLESSE